MGLQELVRGSLQKIYESGRDSEAVLYIPASGLAASGFARTVYASFDFDLGEEEQGADNFGRVAEISFMAFGDHGVEEVATVGDEIKREVTGGFPPERWRIDGARKSADGSEWICKASRFE